MAKKERKPRIPPGKGREWLEKVESGTPVKEISVKEYYDPRTIKKHIREAQQEREAYQARASVLRGALEKHYEDLCELAVKIEETVMYGREVTLDLTEPYIWKALKQHKPKAPLWTHIKQWNDTLSEIEALRQDAHTAIKNYMNKAAKSERVFQYKGVLWGTIDLIEHQFDRWLTGDRGLIIEDSFKVEPIDEHHSNLSCGFAQMGEVRNDDISKIKDVVISYKNKIKRRKTLSNIKKLYTINRSEIRTRIIDELAIIKLKRVVPGHCDYCPA